MPYHRNQKTQVMEETTKNLLAQAKDGQFRVDMNDVPEFSDDVIATNENEIQSAPGVISIGNIPFAQDGVRTFVTDRNFDAEEWDMFSRNGVRIVKSSKGIRREQLQKEIDGILEERQKNEATGPKVYHRNQKEEVMSKTRAILGKRADDGSHSIKFEDVPMFSDDELTSALDAQNGNAKTYIHTEPETDIYAFATISDGLKAGTLEVKPSSVRMRRDELQREVDQRYYLAGDNKNEARRINPDQRKADIQLFMNQKHNYSVSRKKDLCM